jgi:leucyl/phenylalanyl-tRNA--protein transferase
MTILRPNRIQFPDVTKASKEGLLAVGGDLGARRLLLAYRSGIFPWTDDPLTWWSPDPRAIFDLETIKPSRRLGKTIRQGRFVITFDRAFLRVIRQCASRAPGRETTWISERFIHAYADLHHKGHAHSVEAWNAEGELIGGVYGVGIGSFFAGESMFHRQTDASKVALFALFDRLRSRGYQLFDTQVLSPLTQSLGAIEIPRLEYLQRLQLAVNAGVTW